MSSVKMWRSPHISPPKWYGRNEANITERRKINNNNNKAIAIKNTTKFYTHRQRQKKSHYISKRAKMQSVITTSKQTRHQKNKNKN